MRSGAIASLLALGLLLTTPLQAQQADVEAADGIRDTAAGKGALPLEPDENLEPYLDGLMTALMLANRVPGAAVSIVRGDSIVLEKGYGWADIERRIPVDPARTLFRIGSVTKVFTWTAVMQLRDEGLLDLDEDINGYLDFRIPDTYPEPITLRHLMTHTAGFEDRAFGLFRPPTGLSRPEFMRRNLPARVRPPGTFASYSNYGSALAGYIVERVSGMPWEQYLEERILAPLSMEYATGRQPLPQHLAAYEAAGYSHSNERFVRQDFEWMEMAPAGSMSVSAEEMAAFMIAHLNGGAYGNSRLLSEAATREMHSTAFTGDPRVSGMALGFAENRMHGVRTTGHNGATSWFFTDMTLIPSAGVGIFVSTNSPGGGNLVASLTRLLAGRHHADSSGTVGPVVEGWDRRAKSYAGSYRPLRRSYTTFEKFLGAMFEATVSADPHVPGEVVLRTPQLTTRLREVEPGYFRSPDSGVEAAFRQGENGDFSHLFVSALPATALERVRFHDSRLLHGVLLLLGVLTMLSFPLISAVGFVRRLLRGAQRRPGGYERLLTWCTNGFVLLSIAFLVIAGTAVNERSFVTAEAEGAIRTALVLPLVSLPLALATIAGVWPAIRDRYWSTLGRVHYVAVALASIVFIWQLVHWRLLDLPFGNSAVSIMTLHAQEVGTMTEGSHGHHEIDYIEFNVTDMAAAQRFYGAAFDWQFTDYGPEYAGIRKPGGGEAGGFAVQREVKTGGPLVILYSNDLDATLVRVRDVGGEITREIFEFPGGRRFHFRDPSGNELAVWSER